MYKTVKRTDKPCLCCLHLLDKVSETYENPFPEDNVDWHVEFYQCPRCDYREKIYSSNPNLVGISSSPYQEFKERVQQKYGLKPRPEEVLKEIKELILYIQPGEDFDKITGRQTSEISEEEIILLRGKLNLLCDKARKKAEEATAEYCQMGQNDPNLGDFYDNEVSAVYRGLRDIILKIDRLDDLLAQLVKKDEN